MINVNISKRHNRKNRRFFAIVIFNRRRFFIKFDSKNNQKSNFN